MLQAEGRKEIMPMYPSAPCACSCIPGTICRARQEEKMWNLSRSSRGTNGAPPAVSEAQNARVQALQKQLSQLDATSSKIGETLRCAMVTGNCMMPMQHAQTLVTACAVGLEHAVACMQVEDIYILPLHAYMRAHLFSFISFQCTCAHLLITLHRC